MSSETDANTPSDLYSSKIVEKLGATKSKIFGFEANDDDLVEMEEEEEEEATDSPSGQLGALPDQQTPVITAQDLKLEQSQPKPSEPKTTEKLINEALFDADDKDEDGLTEAELIDLVAEKMLERKDDKAKAMEDALQQAAKERIERVEKQYEQQATQVEASATSSQTEAKKLTSGVGGSWNKDKSATEEMYQPKTGSWGAFPRPRDISKAYGGGRRVGPGYSNEETSKKKVEATRDKLRQYREKMGIIVQTELDNADEIEQALKIGEVAMQRGIYNTAVSALEKVTKYCSSNSKVGGKVYLELAMAYEAVGRTDEAITVYTILSKSRIEKIKLNAQRLLYGIEAMQFMQKEIGSRAFSRQQARNTFIDTTGLANIASNFDDVYNTAWIDTEKSFYRKLTQSVVRSSREARQVLLKATGSGEVERLRIVQALRSLARGFEVALEKEIKRKKSEDEEAPEATAFIDGVPIVKKAANDDYLTASLNDDDDFFLASASQMKANLDGDWQLQLIADRQGDGVRFYNTTSSWQKINMEENSFTSEGKASGFLNVQQSGQVVFNDEQRLLERQQLQQSGGGVLAEILGATASGAAGAVSLPQQVMTVDSVLLVTRRNPETRNVDDKEFFAVWRRRDASSQNFEDSALAEMSR